MTGASDNNWVTGGRLAAVLALALVACGEGGGQTSGVAVVNTPTPTASPTPTPSPTATLTSLAPLVQSYSLPASVARLTFTQAKDTPYDVAGADASLGEVGTTALSYDAAAASYMVTGSGGTGSGAAFTSTFPSTSRFTNNNVTQAYAVTSGNVRTTGEFYINGPTGTYLPLSYATSAGVLKVDGSGARNAVEYRTLLTGVKSPTLPSSGVVQYQAKVDGYVVDGAKVYRILGSGSFVVTVDFGQDTVRAPINLTVNSDLSGLQRNQSAFYPIGTIDCHVRRNSTGAARIHSDDHVEYLFSGDFFGPSQDEVGITFMIRAVPGAPIIAMTIMGKRI